MTFSLSKFVHARPNLLCAKIARENEEKNGKTNWIFRV